jgi:hypothetical protein
VSDETRESGCEFNPDPATMQEMTMYLGLSGKLGDVGELKVKTTRSRVFGPDWRNLVEEVFLAVRGQLGK